MQKPKVFSWDELQVDAKTLLEYLNEILQEISQSFDVKIGLLIEANCSSALEPNRIDQTEAAGFMLLGPFLDGVLLTQCTERLI